MNCEFWIHDVWHLAAPVSLHKVTPFVSFICENLFMNDVESKKYFTPTDLMKQNVTLKFLQHTITKNSSKSPA